MTLVFSSQVMVIGMVVVFIGLILLIVCIHFMSKLINSLQKQTAAESAKPEIAVPSFSPEAMATVNAYGASEPGSDELIAVITAALAAYAQSGKTLVVRSVRKLSGNSSAWAQAARSEQLNSRF